ncbi:hypothetical protein LT330_004402 [Penicillium expansum]|uniref:DNA2/NAM7 helicase-like C-terminal domain-containing protein n=1 Tax=Penicillium expansum TaxID=27334 RepID=A0A0A2IVD2_PENEN|nr:hypothetical protein PEX2_093770 [Penicillium expansum]KAK4860671.1 hypothetical protein LT330_004402 [Penicillium expansum]KGO38097.1 hypothetical protein PEX1_073560 [Penicillium expansum]KGO47024.1 hypothetical protein PEXP_064220 [Penicillium expansum]KGO59022.1 hypothetical protein PEX2_093770 [Penicillium expansum]
MQPTDPARVVARMVCTFNRRDYRINKNILCLNHKHDKEEHFGDSTSFFSRAHIVTGINLVRQLLAEGIVHPTEVSIITGYEAQHKAYLAAVTYCHEHDAPGSEDWLNVHVHKIDTYQGKEANIAAIVDLVRMSQLGFMREPQRLNVACSRVRFGLYILYNQTGMKNALNRTPAFFVKAMLQDISENQLSYPAPATDYESEL